MSFTGKIINTGISIKSHPTPKKEKGKPIPACTVPVETSHCAVQVQVADKIYDVYLAKFSFEHRSLLLQYMRALHKASSDTRHQHIDKSIARSNVTCVVEINKGHVSSIRLDESGWTNLNKCKVIENDINALVTAARTRRNRSSANSSSRG